jgi:hypothetical protein
VDRATENLGGAEDGSGERKKMSSARRSAFYLATAFAITASMLGLIINANRRYAPEMYQPDFMETVADAFESGDNFTVFDLNINIRKLREEQWKRLETAPDILVLGASQWQEASADLMPHRNYLNGHIHRDYYEDIPGMVEILVRHDKLPKDLVITVRDRLFTPVAHRTDFLWLPGIPYYQAMAKRLSLPRLTFLETQPLQRPRELLSLSMLVGNMTRWHKASDWPYPTTRKSHPELDVLLSDGSIAWSDSHLALFTPERTRKLSLAHADSSRYNPPLIDPKGVEALDRLLSFLAVKGVRVHLAHPPFNPIYFDRVQDSPYMDGLRQVEAVTRELAARHKLRVVGSFDPKVLKCTADMFIDAEHSNARCLRSLLADVANSVDLRDSPAIASVPAVTTQAEDRSQQALLTSGWFAAERVEPAPQKIEAVTSRFGGSSSRRVEPVIASAVTAGSQAPFSPAPGADSPAPVGESARRSDAAPAVTPATSATDVARRPRKVTPAPRARRESVPSQRRKKVARQPNASAVQTGLIWPGDAAPRRN